MPRESTTVSALLSAASDAPEIVPQNGTRAGATRNTQPDDATRFPWLKVENWLRDRGRKFRVKPERMDDGRTVILLNECPFNPEHGKNGEVCIMQGDRGQLSFKCHHNSCSSYGWQDAKEAIGPPDSRHWDGATLPASCTVNRRVSDPLPVHQELPTLEPGTRVIAGDRGNIGTIVQDNGDSCTVHFVSPEGNEANVNLPKSELRDTNGRPLPGDQSIEMPQILSFAKLRELHPKLAPVLIDGILRRGETLNLIANSKIGKSWLVLSLALSVACGRVWLGRTVSAGRVLLIDNELHAATLAHRLPMVARALGLDESAYLERIDIVTLRGRLIDIATLSPLIHSIDVNRYSLVVADAWYRFYPSGVSENDNAAMAQLYNLIDQYAATTGAAWCLIHHASKGNQGDKRVTDVGSGAGSQSRAADAHIVLREHKEAGHVVMEAAVRSFPPVEPITLRWAWPLWHRAEDVDPTQLANGQEKQQAAKDAEGIQVIRAVLSEGGDWLAARPIRDAANMGESRVKRLLTRMVHDRIIISRHTTHKGREISEYRLSSEKINDPYDTDDGAD